MDEQSFTQPCDNDETGHSQLRNVENKLEDKLKLFELGLEHSNTISCKKEHDWVSVQAPLKQEEIPGGEALKSEWVSVELDGISQSEDGICLSSCTLREWVTVDLPSSENNMRVSEHVCRFSEVVKKCETPLPRTRKRRTISGKIRARIEAFENTFRQELDRLNSPLGKTKSRRVYELKRGAYNATKQDNEQKLNPKICENSNGVTLERKNVPVEEVNFEEGKTEYPTESITYEGECQVGGDWELAFKGAPAEQEEEFQTDEAPEIQEHEIESHQSVGEIGVSGLMKQVISGAALLAGLIFLWPRGNNLIWRTPQKRQRYYMVKQGNRCNEVNPRNLPPFHRLNIDRFKG